MRAPWTIALLFACSDGSELTGVELTLRYDPSLGLEQMLIEGRLDDGTEAFTPGRRPDPPRPLLDGEDSVVLLLSDSLSGRTLTLSVQGTAGGAVAAEGRTDVRVVAKQLVRASMDLAGLPVKDCDAGACPEDAAVDAAFEDAGADAAEEAGMPDADAPDVDEDVGVEEDVGPIDMGEPDTGCPPQAPVIGDGIDQDCDGFDECYQDLDGDDFGSATVVSDDDLSCTNASSPTSSVATDCDDGDPQIYPGTPCNDGSGTSENDLCFGPACRGYETAGCGGNCGNCGPGDCCARGCPGGGCGVCPSGCSCDFECNNAMTCTASCEPGSVCHLFANSGNSATFTCEDGASCDLECNSTSTCRLECEGGAFCIISYCNSSACTLGCTGAAMSCPGGVQVCNRACP